MTLETLHNPDRYMADLRQILSQGKKRIGLLVGAGAPTSIRVNSDGQMSESGNPLIPDVAGLTEYVLNSLTKDDKKVIDLIQSEIEKTPNIEAILTQVRKLSQAIGSMELLGLDGQGFALLAARICDHIGNRVSSELPPGLNPYTEITSWIAGTHRAHPVEIFTPNYDLLMEEAFERERRPFYDGFSGSHNPFFDAASVSSDKLPARWTRLWKLHGSLGWDIKDKLVVRGGGRKATKLIYPDHLKYDEISRQPYSALFDQLKRFMSTPDSLLICTGFSFFDAHISAVLDETLSSNPHAAVFAFQYRDLLSERQAMELAEAHPNFSLYARDAAVVSGIPGLWKPGDLPYDDWEHIRQTFWMQSATNGKHEFILGDFKKLARFFSLTQAQQLKSSPAEPLDAMSAEPDESKA